MEILYETFAEEQNIKIPDNSSLVDLSSIVRFKDDGEYKMVYELCDKYRNVITDDFINFIVRTKSN